MSLFCSIGERRRRFSAGAATISIRAPFYIADKTDLRKAKCVKLRGNRSHFTTVLPFEGVNFNGANCLSEDTDGLQMTVRQPCNFIAHFPPW